MIPEGNPGANSLQFFWAANCKSSLQYMFSLSLAMLLYFTHVDMLRFICLLSVCVGSSAFSDQLTMRKWERERERQREREREKGRYQGFFALCLLHSLSDEREWSRINLNACRQKSPQPPGATYAVSCCSRIWGKSLTTSYFLAIGLAKKLFTLLDLCVSSLRRGHANLLCIVPILTDDPRRESRSQFFAIFLGR